MKNKKVLVMSTLLMAIMLLGIGTYSYFRRTVSGNLTGQTGNLVLVVNEKNAVANESFNVSLNRSEEEPFVIPDDKGTFNINIDSTGSGDDVEVTIVISRVNLPDNLKFYLDANHTKELAMRTYLIKKSDSMTLTIPVYWFWDGSVDDENDSDFMNKSLSANISVSASIGSRSTLYTIMSAQSPVLDTDVDFTQGASSTNGEGLMMMDASQNEEYPILYYRGEVSNNNVVFANKCWLIVRTTGTGGTKLIYNGDVDADGSCTNYSGVGGEEAGEYLGAYIQNSAYNTSYDSPVYVGYMYNDTNKFFIHSEEWTNSWDADGELDIASYVKHLNDNKIDSATGRHAQNLKDSTIKGVIDAWYATNIHDKTAESLIEDTVWCNDRSITSSEYSLENYVTNKAFRFSPTERIKKENGPINPTLECARDVDKFTVSDVLGNGDLTHPVGLLTMDEIWMAGNTYYVDDGNVVTTYLTIPNKTYMSISPTNFNKGGAQIYVVYKGGLYTFNTLYGKKMGVRPSIALELGATVTSGDGSFEKPYIILS